MNGTVWNKLSRRELGLPENSMPIKGGYLGELNGVPITDLNDYRKVMAEPYREVAKLNPKTAAQLQELNSTRGDMRDAYRDATTGGHADDWKRFREANQKAQLLEGEIDATAVSLGQPQLVKRLREARTKIAQSYATENATDASTGIVNAISLGKQLNEGVPLTGELKKIADFANSFYREAIDAGRIGSGAANQSMTGTLRAAATAPLLLSDFTQNLAANPAEKRNFASLLAQYMTNTAREERETTDEERALRGYIQAGGPKTP